MSLSASSATRQYDLILYGATGFTGQLAAEYLQKHYPTLKFALAGRNLRKLEQVRDTITTGTESNDIPLLVADAVQDPASLDELAQSTKVLANYAGSPYHDKALPVVAACAKHGTCYTDITGEPNFQRLSYDRYHEQAQETGALIIHSCGYDSVPSDMGAMLAAQAMQERHSCKCQSMELVSVKSQGYASGGTIKTALGLIFGDVDKIPGMKDIKARGSYGLDPKGASGGPDTSDTVSWVTYDDLCQRYVMPFLMAGANAPVVRKSNALWEYKYGRNCTYREVQAVPGWLSGVAAMVGLGFFGALLAFPPTRYLMTRFVLPKPGEGPTKQQQDEGFFVSKVYAVGEAPDKPKTVAFVKSGTAGDPGYKATARMSIEASLCLALQRDQCEPKGGVLTTATALGMTFVERLNNPQTAGMQLGVEEESTSAPRP